MSERTYTDTVREILSLLRAKTMRPKVTIIASFSNPEAVLAEAKRLEKEYDMEVILPIPEWFERMKRTMGASNATSGHNLSEATRVKKSMNMETYFRAIKEADVVHVFNVKFAKNLNDVPDRENKVGKIDATEFGYEYEYYGMNTLIEIGVAHTLGKKLTAYREPTEPELKSLIAEVI